MYTIGVIFTFFFLLGKKPDTEKTDFIYISALILLSIIFPISLGFNMGYSMRMFYDK